jgi:basic amino acid/polyamine antiporter, APA family
MPTEKLVGEAKLPRVLGPWAAYCVVVGSVIGSGIFIVPSRVATNVPFLGGIAFVWIVGGLFSLAGALTLAELSAMLPSAGGPYVYLREAFGRLPAFLFGWTEFLVIRTGSIATLAAAFALNFAALFPAPFGMKQVAWETIAAVTAIAILAAVNVIGTLFGGRVQVVGTVLKIGALVTMIILPFFPFVLHHADLKLLTPIGPTAYSMDLFGGIMLAMISVLWTYDGWVNASALAEEIKDPGRNIPRALILGLFSLIAIYLGMTLVYHMVLPIGEIQNAPGIVSANFLKALIGDRGPVLISVVIMASTFITLNGNALSGPRAYFAMARDGVFPRGLCKIDPRHQTPANAIIAQTVWAIVLIVAASAFLLIEPPAVDPSSLTPQLSGSDLKYLPSVKDPSGIPTEGYGRVVVANVDNVLHFRAFDKAGQVVVDTDEGRLKEKARAIQDLRAHLQTLSAPHELKTSESGAVIDKVTSIVSRPPTWVAAWATLHKKPLYDVLYTYVIFGGTIFYGLAIMSVFVLRAKRPDLPRPYKTWGYPFTPMLYSAASLLLLGSMLYQSLVESLAGLAIVAAGLPAYLVFSRRGRLDRLD